MSESGPTSDGGYPDEGAKPRRGRNEMVADAFRNKRLPDDWVDEEPEHDEEADDEDDDPEGETYEPHRLPEPESHRLSDTAAKAVGCLVAAITLVVVAIRVHLEPWALWVLWLTFFTFAAGCLYRLNHLVEEHERELTVLLPGVGAIVGAIVLLLFGHGVDPNLGGFFAFTAAAAIAAMGYAVWYNRKHFGWGNAVAVTVIELVLTPIAIVLALLYFFRHDLLKTAVPGVSSSRSSSSRYNGRQMPEIGSVSQSHGTFLVFDERGDLIHQMNFNGSLLGYTSKSFQVQSDRTIFTFDAHCRPLHQRIV